MGKIVGATFGAHKDLNSINIKDYFKIFIFQDFINQNIKSLLTFSADKVHSII